MSSEWPEFKLQDLCEFQNGFAFRNKDYVDGKEDVYEIFRMGYIGRGGGFKEDGNPVFVQKSYHTNLDRFMLREGDITIAMTDMKNSMALLGHTAWVPEDDRFVLNQRVGRIRVLDESKLYPLYLYYYSNSPEYISFLRSRANSGVQVNLSTKAIKESPIKVPPMKVQMVIGDTLGSLDSKIKSNRQISKTLEHIAQALFKSWFVDFEPVKAKMAALGAGGTAEDAEKAAIQAISGKREAELDTLRTQNPDQYDNLVRIAALFPSAMVESELGEIPEGWGLQSVEDVLELRYGKALKRSDRVEGDFPVYGSGGISGMHNQALVEGPGIVVGRKGTVGSVYWEDRDFYPIDTAYYVVPKAGFSMTIAFYLLQSLPLDSMNTDAAVPGLNRKNVYRLGVPAFPKPLVERFDQFIGGISKMIATKTRESETLSEMRDALLPKLLSGELAVPEAEEQMPEAADV